MRWWRRNDGFEWKDYVRTTVLVRRRQRRDKLEAAKEAAVEGVKEAGRKGLAAGAAGADVAGQAAVKIAKSAAEGAAAGAEKGLALAVRGAAAARSRIALASEPINARLSGTRIGWALAVSAVLAGTGTGVRVAQFGWDLDAALLFILAGVTGLLWLWPRLFANTPDAEDEWAVRTERVVAAVDRTGSWLPVVGTAAFAVAVLWFAAPVVSRWVDSVAPAPTEPRQSRELERRGDELAGAARVAGPGLLRIDGVPVRLEGVTMLDPAQTCRREDGSVWACGTTAKQAFEKLVRGSRAITCTISAESDGVRTGTCLMGGQDVGAALVQGGHAFADGFFWAAYSDAERAARDAKAGLWGGEPERPDDWRARIYAEAAATAPGGCLIKGRIQRSRKTYVMPDESDYAKLVVRETRGERWFCSEDEAKTAGFSSREK